MEKSPSGLTAKQERFCQEYIVDLIATEAAKRAGYGEKAAHVQASRLLKNAKVAAHIAELQQAAAKRNEVTVDTVVGMLLDSYDEAKKANQHGPAVRAAELLGKQFGMFIDRHQVDEVSQLSDQQLAVKVAKACGGGDRVLERTLFRNALKTAGQDSFEPRPELSDDQIYRLLGRGRPLSATHGKPEPKIGSGGFSPSQRVCWNACRICPTA